MIDAMKKGLEALEELMPTGPATAELRTNAITALRQAIAEAEGREIAPESWMGVSDNPYCDDADCNDPNSRAMRWHNKLLELRKQVALDGLAETSREIEQEPVAWVKQDVWKGQFMPSTMLPRKIWWECEKNIGFPIYAEPPKREIELDAIDRAYFAGKEAGIAESKIKRNWHGKEPVAYVQDGDLHWHDYVLTTYAAEMHGHDLFTEPPKREWVGLTDEDKICAKYLQDAPDGIAAVIEYIEAKLKELNHD